MYKAFKYRLYPTEPQKELIAKHIGSSRFMFNLALETKNAAYIGSKHNYSAFDLVKQLPELKKELPWLKEVNSQSLQQSIQNMDIAFKKFFKGAGFPKFKSKHKGKRTKKKLAKLHEDVVNKRKDFLHKTSTKLIRENQTICLETLAVKNMIKNHDLAQAISDVSWSTFVSMLEYKADWYGENILRIGQFSPSSKTCSNCGNINKELTLKDREWTCSICSTVLDRDVNAAINIKSFALKNIFSGTESRNQDELPRLLGVLTPEAQPIGSAVGG